MAEEEGVADHEHAMTGWQEWMEDLATGMHQWRAAHPKATFAEIERAVEERIDTLRAQLLQDLVAVSAATDVASQPVAERPRGPAGGELMEARGRQDRALTVPGNRLVRLRRSSVGCPACGAGRFPPGRGVGTPGGESVSAPGRKRGAAGNADSL